MTVPVAPRTAPCIPWDQAGAHCLASLLLGTRCCPRGDCALCRREQARVGRFGAPRTVVPREATRRAGLGDRCPVCGFPPPPPLQEIPPLPRLDRSDSVLGGRHDCRLCGKPLPPRQRTYCSFSCWREYVRQNEMEGDDVSTPSPPRVYRMGAATGHSGIG